MAAINVAERNFGHDSADRMITGLEPTKSSRNRRVTNNFRIGIARIFTRSGLRAFQFRKVGSRFLQRDQSVSICVDGIKNRRLREFRGSDAAVVISVEFQKSLVDFCHALLKLIGTLQGGVD